VRLGVDAQELPIGRKDLGVQQAVDGEPVLAGKTANASAERDPADPDRAGVAEPDRQSVRRKCRGDLAGGQARLDPGGAPIHVHVQRLHVPQVEHDPPVRRAMARAAVATAPDGQLVPGLARQCNDARDIGRIRDADDDPWARVDPAQDDHARLVVLGIVRRDDAAREVGAELGDIEDRCERGRHLHLL